MNPFGVRRSIMEEMCIYAIATPAIVDPCCMPKMAGYCWRIHLGASRSLSWEDLRRLMCHPEVPHVAAAQAHSSRPR
jgi:hypothetical protein